MAIVYIGIGSNAGDRNSHIQKALGLLRDHENVKLLAVSNLIETEPENDPSQEKYLNGALKINTDLMPLDLLSALKNIERRCGRIRPVSGAPRTLDLDILTYDDVVIVEGKTLSIPHPKLHERFFVLKPLLEIAPEWLHPRLGKNAQQLLEDLTESAPYSH